MLIFTVENILAMEEGPEIDTLIGETITKFLPETKFLATDASGKKIYNIFDSEEDANKWHNNLMTGFPKGHYAKNGGHIVQKKIYPDYSRHHTDIWMAIEKLKEMGLVREYIRALFKVIYCKDALNTLDPSFFSNKDISETVFGLLQATALQKCKAALIAVLQLSY